MRRNKSLKENKNYMKKIKKKKITFNLAIFVIILIFTIVFLLTFFFLTSYPQTKVNETFKNQTNETLNITNITGPFQENISIEVPPGVVKIGKGGRIQTV
jgi:heme/copper-type cytochrome/quinol oxidase subunit 2